MDKFDLKKYLVEGKLLNEVDLPTNLIQKFASEIKDAPGFARAMLGIYNAIQAKEQIDFSKNQKFGRVLQFLRDIADSKPQGGEEMQNEILGFGKHDFEKLKFSRDGFTANANGGVLYIVSNAIRSAPALGPFKLKNNNRSFDTSDRKTRKLLKKVQGFDRYTRRRIREALRDEGRDIGSLATAFADGASIKTLRK